MSRGFTLLELLVVVAIIAVLASYVAPRYFSQVGKSEVTLTKAQLRTRSAYNTYLHRALPPGPIDSPGLASLKAAAHAAHTHFLYYVVKPGTCGKHAFSSSYAQFLRDSKRYNAARAASGGRSPEHC